MIPRLDAECCSHSVRARERAQPLGDITPAKRDLFPRRCYQRLHVPSCRPSLSPQPVTSNGGLANALKPSTAPIPVVPHRTVQRGIIIAMRLASGIRACSACGNASGCEIHTSSVTPLRAGGNLQDVDNRLVASYGVVLDGDVAVLEASLSDTTDRTIATNRYSATLISTGSSNHARPSAHKLFGRNVRRLEQATDEWIAPQQPERGRHAADGDCEGLRDRAMGPQPCDLPADQAR